MKERVYDENNKDYPRYGGRGIVLCAEWHDFKSFCDWAWGNGFEPGLEIDRADTNGDYEPSNCRFTTRKINGQNTSASKWWFVHGKRFESLADAAEHFSVTRTTIAAWCNGKRRGERYQPPKQDCWSELKYL